MTEPPSPLRMLLSRHTKRRAFISLLGAAAAWPLAARAQQRGRIRRIGVLLPAFPDDPVWQARLGAFLQGLAILGWGIGHNLRIETRWATPNITDIRRHSAELAALAPDVAQAGSGRVETAYRLAHNSATRTYPTEIRLRG